jgi:hypothetical protein
MNYKELNGHSIREGFNKFHKENPHVFDAFEEQVLKAIKRGRKKTDKTKQMEKELKELRRYQKDMEATLYNPEKLANLIGGL